MTIKILLYMLFIYILIFSITGCDREGENIPTAAITADMYLENGWADYEAARFDKAVAAFTAASQRDAVMLDAYNGLGWSLAQVADYENSIAYFKLLLSMTEDSSLIADCYAGLTMTYAAYRELPVAAGNPDTIAIEYANKILQLDPDYVFAHDANVNTATIHVVIAQSNFNSENFIITFNYIDTYVEPGFRQSLFEDGTIVQVNDDSIEVSVSGTTTQNGTAVLNIDGKELVDAISVAKSNLEGSYIVVSFDEGGREIVFKGNPIPQEKEIYLVDYHYAPVYGIFLSKLLAKIEQYQP